MFVFLFTFVKEDIDKLLSVFVDVNANANVVIDVVVVVSLVRLTCSSASVMTLCYVLAFSDGFPKTRALACFVLKGFCFPSSLSHSPSLSLTLSHSLSRSEARVSSPQSPVLSARIRYHPSPYQTTERPVFRKLETPFFVERTYRVND
jgi:hypothetical protein